MSNINKLNILGTEVNIPSFENKQTLDGFSETEEGKLLWNNEPIEGSGKDLPNNITYFDDTEEEVEIPIIPQLDDMSPIGTIISYMGTKAPDDFLICDGTIYNISKYKKLANHFKEQFGSYNFFGGDGETTFAVPNLQGEFLRGSGTNSHANQGSGADVGVHQNGTETPLLNINSNNDVVWWNNAIDRETTQADYYTKTNDCSGFCTQKAVLGTGLTGNVKITSRPTNTSVLYCIKYEDNVTKIINNHVYSTKERIVGKWIDEKPIYEKSTEFTIDKHYSGDHIWTDPIPNFDVMIDIKGTMRIPSGRFFNLPHVSINNNYGVNMVANADGSIVLDTGSGDRTNSVVRVTIQYTKTTDTSSLAEAALEEK